MKKAGEIPLNLNYLACLLINILYAVVIKNCFAFVS